MGAEHIVTAVLLRTWDPFALSVLRVGLACVGFVGLVALTHGLHFPRHIIKPMHWMMTSGAFAIFILLYNLGLEFSDPVTAAAVMAGTPVYAAITLRFATKKPLERGFFIAAILTIIGSLIALSSNFGGADDTTPGAGALLILLSFIFWNLFTLGVQHHFIPSSSQLMRTVMCFLGAVIWLSLGWLLLREFDVAPPPNMNPSSTALWLLLVTALFITAGGAFFWNIGVSRLGLATGSLWQNMVPVFGVVIAAIVGYIPSIGQIVGGLIVLAGVLWMQRSKSAT